MMVTAVTMLAGMLAMAAVLAGVAAFRRPLPELADTLANLSVPFAELGDPAMATAQAGMVDRWGTWLLRVARFSPSAKQAAQLRLRGISLSRFYGERLASALICALMVLLVSVLAGTAGLHFSLPVPAGLVVVAALFGWFLPALRIASSAAVVSEDASEALLVYIDLVVLERMANQHARDALTRAAGVSDNQLFVQIRAALTRAELEREQPWEELRRLADRLNMPELADVADVARLQDEGGSLADAFRARVSELRNAHTVRRLREADKLTQRMEIPKTLPVLIVALIFILPPLMQIAAG